MHVAGDRLLLLRLTIGVEVSLLYVDIYDWLHLHLSLRYCLKRLSLIHIAVNIDNRGSISFSNSDSLRRQLRHLKLFLLRSFGGLEASMGIVPGLLRLKRRFQT